MMYVQVYVRGAVGNSAAIVPRYVLVKRGMYRADNMCGGFFLLHDFYQKECSRCLYKSTTFLKKNFVWLTLL